MIDTDKHPLTSEPTWLFTQPYINVRSSVFLKDVETAEEIRMNIMSFSHCREGLISDIRTTLKKRTTNFIKKGECAWEGVLAPTHSLTLNDSRCLGAWDTVLSVLDVPDPTTGPIIKDNVVKKFLKVADAIVGIPSLLLNPNREPGDWWRTDTKTACRGDSHRRFIDWGGADNFLLRHPALLAIITGLYRQAFWLCRSGYEDKVLASVDYSQVEKVLTKPTWKEALELAEQLKTWISVPVPQRGSVGNVSFPWYPRASKQVSYWQRFIRLQRALHRHSADEVFAGDIFESWALLNKGSQFSGAISFWGEAKRLTPAHKRLMELGKPKEKTSESK